jgi:hypothetical protein
MISPEDAAQHVEVSGNGDLAQQMLQIVSIIR